MWGGGDLVWFSNERVVREDEERERERARERERERERESYTYDDSPSFFILSVSHERERVRERERVEREKNRFCFVSTVFCPHDRPPTNPADRPSSSVSTVLFNTTTDRP